MKTQKHDGEGGRTEDEYLLFEILIVRTLHNGKITHNGNLTQMPYANLVIIS
jgi:hypothetical protein